MWRDHWQIVALRTESLKLIWNSREPDAPRLYDLAADPAEREDASERFPQEKERLLRRLQQHLDYVASFGDVAAVAVAADEAVLSRLRDLGYVD
jgi:hypothetical protein